MALPKNPKYDLKRKYGRVVKIGIIISLLATIAEFKYFPEIEGAKIELKPPQELIDIQNVEVTKHDAAPKNSFIEEEEEKIN